MATKSPKKTTKPSEEMINETVIEETAIVEEKNVTKAEVATKPVKKYEPDTLVPCRSVTAGELLCSAKKSGILYRWANQGSIEDVRYEDLQYMRDSRSTYIFSPLFVIEDEELLAQDRWDKVKKAYDDMITIADIDQILNLPKNQFKSVLKKLPKSIQNSIKIVITERIEDGTFDSIQKIQAVDEILGSDLICLIR